MSEETPGVLAGRVLAWHREEGWGVLTSPAMPHEVWAHYSAIQAEGFRELTAGQSVRFSVEQAEQDEFHWRAVRIWTDAPPPTADADGGSGSGFSSDLDITFDT